MKQFRVIKKIFLTTLLLGHCASLSPAAEKKAEEQSCLARISNHIPATSADSTLHALATKSSEKSKLANNASIDKITFVAFDTETTGFSPEKDRIVEIGAVKFTDGKIEAKGEWLVNPDRDIPHYATRVHKITDEMVERKPGFKEVCPRFVEFAKGSVLLAHNSRFDRDFMKAEMERAGLESPDLPLLDTLKLFRELFPDAPSHSTKKLVDHLDIEPGRYHRALVDCTYIVEIFRKIPADTKSKLRYEDLVEMNGGPDKLYERANPK